MSGLKNKKYSKDWRPGHCNEFFHKAFTSLLEKTDFELVDWHTYSNKPVADLIYRLAPIGDKARALVRKVSKAAAVPLSVETIGVSMFD